MQYTRPPLAVTDAFERAIVASRYCSSVTVQEVPDSSAFPNPGWPRAYLFRGSAAGSQQQTQSQGSIYTIPGPFHAGDTVGTLELVPAAGDSSFFNVLEAQAG